MKNVVLKGYTVLYMGVEVIICHSERFPKRLMISQTPSIGWTSNQPRLEKEHVGKTLPAFGVIFAKPFLLKIGYSIPSKIVEFCMFHMSVFVNMTNMVVNTDTDSTCAQKL